MDEVPGPNVTAPDEEGRKSVAARASGEVREMAMLRQRSGWPVSAIKS